MKHYCFDCEQEMNKSAMIIADNFQSYNDEGIKILLCTSCKQKYHHQVFLKRREEHLKKKVEWINNLEKTNEKIKTWKIEFIKKQRLKNPNISIEELNKRIKRAKVRKFKDEGDFIFKHPDYPYTN